MTNAPAPVDLPGWTHVHSGKVRDLYVPDESGDAAAPDRMLIVASDRVSAFDHVLSPGIPGKGAVLTAVSEWWFSRLAGGDGGRPLPNHLTGQAPPAPVAERAMVVKTLTMAPIECVVRGYLTGSGWVEYQASRTVCGIALPEGLRNGDRLPQPIFTPAYKAPMGEHDENISFAQAETLVGAPLAAALRDTSLEIYERAAAAAAERGLILADTKFEFGTDADGILTLGDEVLTPDSSRYWDLETWQAGGTDAERLASFDKQIVRDWLASHWDRKGTPPELPAEIVERTADRYRELRARLTRL